MPEVGPGTAADVRGRTVATPVKITDTRGYVFDNDSIWVLSEDSATLRRLRTDYRTPIDAPIKTGLVVSDFEVVDGSVWMIDTDTATVAQAVVG